MTAHHSDVMTPQGSAPTLYDVARLAGVSHQTVSRVVNDSDRVKPETAAAVRKAIAALCYTPNLAARALAQGSSAAFLGVTQPHSPRTTT